MAVRAMLMVPRPHMLAFMVSVKSSAKGTHEGLALLTALSGFGICLVPTSILVLLQAHVCGSKSDVVLC